MSPNNSFEATAGWRPQRQAAIVFKEKELPEAKQDLHDSESSQRRKVPKGTDSLINEASFDGFRCLRMRCYGVASLDVVLRCTSEYQLKPRSFAIPSSAFDFIYGQYAAMLKRNKRCREEAPAGSGSSDRTGVHAATLLTEHTPSDDEASAPKRSCHAVVSWDKLLLELQEQLLPLERQRENARKPVSTTGLEGKDVGMVQASTFQVQAPAPALRRSARRAGRRA